MNDAPAATPDADAAALPLAGLRVVEFVHMVMGPSAGLILGDLGAEVIKVEPPAGDKTRNLRGSGAGFFPTYNRNKKSIAIDLGRPEGREAALRMIATADILTENFRPGGMDALGLGWEAASARHPGLIYCSLKGFLKGPYEHRKALDEVVQYMGGLAYMTGPPGRPLRAGASVNDVMGGMFAVIAILAALRERDRHGRGQHVAAALFENNAFLVGQHMAEYAVTGKAPNPMPARRPAWAIYSVFDCADDSQLFVGIVTDGQWRAFCRHFALDALLADESLATNVQRAEQRDRIYPVITDIFRRHTQAELIALCETIELPYAPIARPEDLFDDVHLNASGGLTPVTLPDGRASKVPALPIEMAGRRFGTRLDLPRIGQHGAELLANAGYGPDEIARLAADGVVKA